MLSVNRRNKSIQMPNFVHYYSCINTYIKIPGSSTASPIFRRMRFPWASVNSQKSLPIYTFNCIVD